MAHKTNFGTGEARLKAMSQAGFPGGVAVDPTPVTAGQEITILYNGLLDQSGADQVYLHCGLGPHRQWRDARDLQMTGTGWGWVCTVKMPDYESRFNFCFKDSAGNWDNNNGFNWSYEVHDGSKRI
ncbi:MAG: carbohydrate-binding protein [Peptococcaceae bacterium]|nr:MAG: carbohydrate-binding protein [Peptococcaceae bacterium]